jgi:TPP-dependent pyruvate/acetoin dehydrogenase alpha subunit
VVARSRLVSERGLTESEMDAIAARVKERIDAAISWADAQPEPPVEWAFEDLYADSATLAAFGGAVR